MPTAFSTKLYLNTGTTVMISVHDVWACSIISKTTSQSRSFQSSQNSRSNLYSKPISDHKNQFRHIQVLVLCDVYSKFLFLNNKSKFAKSITGWIAKNDQKETDNLKLSVSNRISKFWIVWNTKFINNICIERLMSVILLIVNVTLPLNVWIYNIHILAIETFIKVINLISQMINRRVIDAVFCCW